MAEAKRGRGRPKKANPELAPVGAGHNDLTDEQKRALFVSSLGRLERLIEEARSANGAIRAQRKLMKSEGFSKIEIDYALYLRSKTDDDARERLEAQLRVAAWLNHPLGHQATLFDEDRRPDIDKARDDGHFAGIEGKPMKPPFDAGNDR